MRGGVGYRRRSSPRTKSSRESVWGRVNTATRSKTRWRMAKVAISAVRQCPDERDRANGRNESQPSPLEITAVLPVSANMVPYNCHEIPVKWHARAGSDRCRRRYRAEGRRTASSRADRRTASAERAVSGSDAKYRGAERLYAACRKFLQAAVHDSSPVGGGGQDRLAQSL